MGEIETSDVHTGVKHLDELLFGGARWTEGADDLGLPLADVCLFDD